jgi:phosphatidylinositol alpha 1,6-mannosyltransferase
MRIAHVSDCYLPRLGGIEVQVRATSIAQAARGDRVSVITATPGESTPDPGIDVVRVDANLPFDTPVHPLGIQRIRAALEAIRPDVVHVHAGVVSPFAWMGIAAAKGLPTVVTVHSMWGPLAQRGFSLLVRDERSFVVTAVSKVAAEAVAAAIDEDVLVTPNAIDPRPWRLVAPNPHADIHVVSALRFAPRKRVMALLQSLRDARRWVPAEIEMRATICGDGPLMSQARNYVFTHGLDWIALPGRVSRDALAQVYADADIYVQPSLRESFGLAALEARAAGVPVIGHAGSGLSEFVTDGVNGLLVHGDAGMSAAIRRLVTDDELRHRFAAFNREHAVVHTWEHALRALDSAYARAADRR